MKDLYIDSNYGDFSFKNDIQMVQGYTGLLNVINERLKTNPLDFRLQPTLGTNIDKHIGKAISISSIESIKLKMQHALTYDGLINESDLSIMHLQLDYNTVFFKVFINYKGTEISTDTTLTFKE